MIPQMNAQAKPSSWQQSLIDAITDPKELVEILDLPISIIEPAIVAGTNFKLKVPRSYVQRIRKGDINDPLLQQILPITKENVPQPGFIAEPLQEQQASQLPGLLHKYKSRVLITISGACAINCRYCFRRNFPYHEHVPGRNGLTKILDYVSFNPEITEIILSGGDPLTVTDDYLAWFLDKLHNIPHIKTIRLHTRLPIMIPERITDKLVNLLSQSPLKTVMVFHINHPNEITDEVKHICKILTSRRIHLLNQTVLLKNINDQVEILEQLSNTLFDAHILPYYLHLLDKVTGSAHFEISEQRAIQLVTQLTTLLPGYLTPKLVKELPNHPAKVPIPITILPSK